MDAGLEFCMPLPICSCSDWDVVGPEGYAFLVLKMNYSSGSITLHSSDRVSEHRVSHISSVIAFEASTNIEVGTSEC